MGIAIDATGVAQNNAASVSSFNYNGITVGSGLINAALLVFVGWSGGVTSPSAIWDSGGTNQSMFIVQLGTTANIQSTIFGLVNPTPGNKICALSWNNAHAVAACAESYTGVLQAGGVSTWPNGANTNATGTTASLAITSVPGNLPITLTRCIITSALSAPNQQQIFLNSTSVNILGQRAAGAPSVTFSSTVTPSGTWIMSGADMVQAAPLSPGGFTAAEW